MLQPRAQSGGSQGLGTARQVLQSQDQIHPNFHFLSQTQSSFGHVQKSSLLAACYKLPSYWRLQLAVLLILEQSVLIPVQWTSTGLDIPLGGITWLPVGVICD